MATAPYSSPAQQQVRPFVDRWFFTGMAIVMLIVALAGFMPSIVSPARRPAPLTLLAAAHGIAFFAWLVLFLIQSLLVAMGRVGWHRRLGLASIVLLALIIPLTFETSAALMRRGFDLSGDSHISPHPKVVEGKTVELDAGADAAFNVGSLLAFPLLAITAICYRRRSEIHKRLMLFANIAIMVAPIQHLMGHIPSVVLSPATIVIPFTCFLLAGVARDYLVAKRIHPLTALLATTLFILQPLEGAVIGPSVAWHRFAAWLFQ